MKQIIIALGREFGSGGHIVAQKLAEHYDIPLYNKEFMAEVAKDGEYSKEILEMFDERHVNLAFIPVRIDGPTVTLEQNVAFKQFDFLQKKANQDKESFVIVGRCADQILKDNPNMVSVFILGDKEGKMKRVMEREGIDKKSALSRMKKVDKMRKTYHNFYCENKWGDSRSYDLCINTTKIDFDTAENIIINYVDSKK